MNVAREPADRNTALRSKALTPEAVYWSKEENRHG
jgi:hypothetical protein